MSMHDKNLIMFDRRALAAAAGTSVTSKVVDLRYNGDDLHARMWVNAFMAKAPRAAGGTASSVQFKLQTSYDGSSWVDLFDKTIPATASNDDDVLMRAPVPVGVRRYIRALVTVGSSALASANSVFAEITDTVDHELDGRMVQHWEGIPAGGSVPAGPEDLGTSGDTVTAGA